MNQQVNQFNATGELTHLLTLEGLPKEQILHILDTAKQFVSVTDPAREVKKVPLLYGRQLLVDRSAGSIWSVQRDLF